MLDGHLLGPHGPARDAPMLIVEDEDTPNDDSRGDRDALECFHRYKPHPGTENM
jgi:hypothetical protein